MNSSEAKTDVPETLQANPWKVSASLLDHIEYRYRKWRAINIGGSVVCAILAVLLVAIFEHIVYAFPFFCMTGIFVLLWMDAQNHLKRMPLQKQTARANPHPPENKSDARQTAQQEQKNT